MRVVVDIGHPGHVHFFRHFIHAIMSRGHEVLITASDKEMACRLLEEYGLGYVKIGRPGDNKIRKVLSALWFDIKMVGVLRKFRPDLVLGIASLRGPHAAFLLGKTSINFDDTEHSNLEIGLYLPFVKQVFTPSCFKRDLGPKQVRYQGYHELAYLHPRRFQPNPATLKELGCKETEKLFVLRFVSWGAIHDIGQRGFSDREKETLVNFLKARGRVVITSEAPLPPNLRTYQMPISPAKIHDLLYYATLYIGEGATMASEAAVLGTPAIYINTLKVGYVEEQEKRYGLCVACRDGQEILAKAKEWLELNDLKALWQTKRERMLKEKIDVTDLLVDLVEKGKG